MNIFGFFLVLFRESVSVFQIFLFVFDFVCAVYCFLQTELALAKKIVVKIFQIMASQTKSQHSVSAWRGKERVQVALMHNFTNVISICIYVRVWVVVCIE